MPRLLTGGLEAVMTDLMVAPPARGWRRGRASGQRGPGHQWRSLLGVNDNRAERGQSVRHRRFAQRYPPVSPTRHMPTTLGRSEPCRGMGPPCSPARADHASHAAGNQRPPR